MIDEFEFLYKGLVSSSHLTGGALRAKMGALVENFIDISWDNLCQKYPNIIAHRTVGKESPIIIYGNYKESVDRHLFLNNQLSIAIECKTYLDKCYLQRADSDFSLLKSRYPNLITYVVSLQDSVNHDTLQYYLSRGNITNIFFLCEERRKSGMTNHISNHPQFLQKEKVQFFLLQLEKDFLKNKGETSQKMSPHFLLYHIIYTD